MWPGDPTQIMTMSATDGAAADGNGRLPRSRRFSAPEILELPLAAYLARLQFEANQSAFRHIRELLDSVRAENLSTCDEALSARARAHRAIAWSTQLRDARAARPA